MRKLFSSSTLLLFSLVLNAQTPTAKDPRQTQLETRVQTLRAQLSALASALADTTRTARFSPELIDSVYAAQRQLEDISYQIYERTDYPPTPDMPIDSVPPDPGMPGDEPSGDEPPPSLPSTFGGFKRPNSPRTIFRFGYSFGLTDLADVGDFRQGVDFPTFDIDKSRFSSIQFVLETRLGKRDTSHFSFGGFNPKKPWKREDQFKNSRLSLRIGATFDRFRVAEVTSRGLSANASGRAQFAPLGFNARSNFICIRQISVPVVLQMKIGQKMLVQTGIFGGIRTRAEQEVAYGEGNFEFIRSQKDEFGMRKFTYGLIAAFGLEGLQMSGKFSLNPLFKNSGDYDLRLFSYGLTLSL